VGSRKGGREGGGGRGGKVGEGWGRGTVEEREGQKRWGRGHVGEKVESFLVELTLGRHTPPAGKTGLLSWASKGRGGGKSRRPGETTSYFQKMRDCIILAGGPKSKGMTREQTRRDQSSWCQMREGHLVNRASRQNGREIKPQNALIGKNIPLQKKPYKLHLSKIREERRKPTTSEASLERKGARNDV